MLPDLYDQNLKTAERDGLPFFQERTEMNFKEYKQYGPVKFSLLRHACDNHGVDEWNEILKINMPDCGEKTMYRVAVWLTDNMEMFPDKDGPFARFHKKHSAVPDRQMRSFPRDDLVDLQFAMMESMTFHGMNRDSIGPITSVGEFFFMNHCQGYNSYESFYIPIDNVLEYMSRNKDALWDKAEETKEQAK